MEYNLLNLILYGMDVRRRARGIEVTNKGSHNDNLHDAGEYKYRPDANRALAVIGNESTDNHHDVDDTNEKDLRVGRQSQCAIKRESSGESTQSAPL